MTCEIIFQDFWAIVLALGIIIIFISLLVKNTKAEKEIHEFTMGLKTRELEFQKREAELKLELQKLTNDEIEKFKNTELEKAQKELEIHALRIANVKLIEWKIENEAKIRQDAINRSYSVNLGKITEHLVPFHQSFLAQFNPKDARFIGSPIDLIVFDGYSDKKDEITIYLVEIKTGNSRLTEIQKKIKSAVINKCNIRWAEINPDNPEANEVAGNDLLNS